jgi:hypothetical protein
MPYGFNDNKSKFTLAESISLIEAALDGRLIPIGGEVGQVPTKAADGVEWGDAGGSSADPEISPDSTRPVQSAAVYNALLGKQDVISNASPGSAGSSAATSGKTISIPYVTFDDQGHAIAKGVRNHTVNNLPASAISSGTFDPARVFDWVCQNAGTYVADPYINVSSSRYGSFGNAGWSCVRIHPNLCLMFGVAKVAVPVHTAYHESFRNSVDLYLRLPNVGGSVGELCRIIGAFASVQGGSAGDDVDMRFGGTRPGNWTPVGTEFDNIDHFDIPFRIVSPHDYGASSQTFYFSVAVVAYVY